MSIETALADLTAATKENTAILQRVVAGQEAAMAKLAEGSGSGTTTRRSRKAADEAVVTGPVEGTAKTAEVSPTETPKSTVHPLLVDAKADIGKVKDPKSGEMVDAPTPKYRAADFGFNEVKNEFVGYLGETDDINERKARGEFIGAVAQHLGAGKPFHPTEGFKTDEERKQALFYLRRKRAGLDVNFSQDYDFDADPLTDKTAAVVEPEEDDPLG